MPTCLRCRGSGVVGFSGRHNKPCSQYCQACKGKRTVDKQTQKDQLDRLTMLVNEESKGT